MFRKISVMKKKISKVAKETLKEFPKLYGLYERENLLKEFQEEY